MPKCSGVGRLDAAFGASNGRGWQVILDTGQSNDAGGYSLATEYDLILQYPQNNTLRAYNLFCHHQATAPTGAFAEDDVLKPVQPWQMGTATAPFPVSGPLVGSWQLNLAHGLRQMGVKPAILSFAWGGENLDFWVPGAPGSYYNLIVGWWDARLAELSALGPILPNFVLHMYQGESGNGTQANWQTGFATFMAAIRAHYSQPSMPCVVVGLPATYTPGSTIRTEQDLYVASDPHSLLARNDGSTYIVNPGPPNLHIDVPSGTALAVGPNDSLVTSVLSCDLQLLR